MSPRLMTSVSPPALKHSQRDMKGRLCSSAVVKILSRLLTVAVQG